MWNPDYYVRYVALPHTVEGLTVPNSDGSFDIYVNSELSDEVQKETLAHELRHIRKDHFYNDVAPLSHLEAEANNKPVPPVKEPPRQKVREIPVFSSPEELGRWILSFSDTARSQTRTGT